MTRHRTSVAMTAEIAEAMRQHVARDDGQEDVCLFTYRPSTGRLRRTALVTSILTPKPGERSVHGNASIEGDYVLRAAAIAHARGDGIGICHSHPAGRGWQSMSAEDRDAEVSFANLAREITTLPMVGMTYAGGDGTWSARHWDTGQAGEIQRTDADNVRVIGDTLSVSWNDAKVPLPAIMSNQARTVSCWGSQAHLSLARRHVLVVGAGSVGLDVATRLAATGIVNVGVMDFDTVEEHNLDRLVGARSLDAALHRAKTYVARRQMLAASTAGEPQFEFFHTSVCERGGLVAALDYDVIISCVDRPWPRAVLNQLAFTDLIPIIDGGIAVDVFEDGSGMRNATWRSHVVRPGRACLVCNDQLEPTEVSLDIDGLLEDRAYIAGADAASDAGHNVAVLSIGVAAALLAQFVSFNVGVGGIGDPGPLQFTLNTHALEHLDYECRPGCAHVASLGVGDQRLDMTGTDQTAVQGQKPTRPQWSRRLLRWADDLITRIQRLIDNNF